MSPCHTKAAACVYIDIPLVTAMQGFAEDTTPPLKNAGSQQQTKAMPCITLALGHSKQFCIGTPQSSAAIERVRGKKYENCERYENFRIRKEKNKAPKKRR